MLEFAAGVDRGGKATCHTSAAIGVRLGLVAAAVLLVGPMAAQAQVYWSNTASGDWSNAGNWGGNHVPISTDNAWIVNGGTANVTQPGETCGTLLLGSSAGGGTVQMTGGGLSIPLAGHGEDVGDSGTGSFTQSGGTNNISSLLCVGYNAGSSGTYNLSGSGQVSAPFEYVGYSGTGAFTQSGGTNSITGSLYLAYNPGISSSSGKYSLNGSGRLSASSEYVGYDDGTGSFTQSGGTNIIASALYVSDSVPGSIGAYSLGGNSQLSASSEYVGYAGTGTFTQSGGTNSISDGLYLGGSDCKVATYNLNGGVLILSSLNKNAGTTTFNFNGGTLQAGSGFSTSLPMTLGASGSGASFDTAGFAVTLSGALSGTGILTKVDSGTLILSATNTYTGNTLVSGGTLALGSPLALQNSTLDSSGSGSLSFASLTAATFGGLTGPGTLNLANSASRTVTLSVGKNNASTTFSAALNGPGSLTKIGTGALALTGSSTYTGPTTIDQGTLVVDGWLTSSAATVNSGGTLGGTGNLVSALINAGGHLAPGDLGTGSINFANAIDFKGGELDIVAAGSSMTSLSTAGNLILSDSPTLDLTGTLSPGTYIIASYSGSLSGNFGTLIIPTGDTINYGTGSDSLITLSAVPEPLSLTLLAAGATCLLAYSRRRSAARRTAKPVACDQLHTPAILSFPSHPSSAHAARRAA